MKQIVLSIFIFLISYEISFSQADYVTTLTFPAGYQIGDYIEFLQVAPEMAGSSGFYEISIAYTRNGVAAAATHLASLSHSNPAVWREVGRVNSNVYVYAGYYNFTIDCNSQYGSPRFRIRAVNTLGSIDATLPISIKVRSINFNSSWTSLNNTGNDLSVSKFLPMTNDWNLYVGNPFTSDGANLALRAIENGNVGVGVLNPYYKLEVAGDMRLIKSDTDPSILLQRQDWGTTSIRQAGPSLELSNDIHHQGASINFLTKNSDGSQTSKMTIKNDGHVGIGTISPASPLDLVGGGVNGTLRVKGGDMGVGSFIANFTQWDNSSLLFLRGDGKVGVGTTSPSEKFVVQEELGNDAIAIYDSPGNKRLGIGQEASYTGNYIDSRNIDFKIKSGYAGGSGGNIIFMTQSSGIDNHPERMRIDKTGNVGIGISGSAYKLDVKSDDYLNLRISANRPLIKLSSPQYNNGNGAEIWQNIDGGLYFNVNGNKTVLYSNAEGNIGIGTYNTYNYKLAVGGDMIAESVKVKPKGEWPDYVFKPEHQILSLPQLEKYIHENNHLPDIPSESEVKKEGLDLGNMDAKLLQKVEELTLYMLDVNKKLETLMIENEALKLKVKALEK